MPDEGPDKISWGRVWGHFCLSYGDVKLITDADLIEKYGIKDDDQLHFTRHISTKVQKVKQTVPQEHSYTPLSSSVEGELKNEEGYKDSEIQKGRCERLRSTCSKLPSLKRAGTFKNRGCRKPQIFYWVDEKVPFDPLSDPKPTFPTPPDSVIQSTITSSICVAKNEITFCKTSCSRLHKKLKKKNLFSFQFAQHNLTSYRHLKLKRVCHFPYFLKPEAMASMIMASSKPVISIAASSSFFSKPKLKQIPQLSLPKLPTPKFLKTQQIPSLSSTTLKSISLFTVTTLSFAPPSVAAEIEKAALFDFNLTLPIMMVQFLFLMFALDKVYFTPLGKFMDERDAAIKEKLASVKDTSEEVKQLEEQAAAIMRAARAEIAAALNKMKKETQLEVEEKLAEGRKKVEAELQEALANLENQKEETIKSLDSQIAALSQDIVKKVLPL
ncbi:hypothetical protein ES288_A07G034900v1 [Gossypium darwinii]|nr:hypothetical protein ES288_A07G034900v1 [Gossypium darwinii]